MPTFRAHPIRTDMRFVLPLAVFGLLVAGCDTGSSGPDPDPDPVCGNSGLSSQGSFSASVDGTAFTANCFEVAIVEVTAPGGAIDVLTITGVNYTVSDPRGEFIGLVTGTAGTGVYSIEQRDITATAAEAEYVVDGDAILAESGTVTITQYSSSRVQGEFDFEGDDGATTVTGQFDISY